MTRPAACRLLPARSRSSRLAGAPAQRVASAKAGWAAGRGGGVSAAVRRGCVLIKRVAIGIRACLPKSANGPRRTRNGLPSPAPPPGYHIDPHPVQIAPGQPCRGAMGWIGATRVPGSPIDPARAASASRACRVGRARQRLASPPVGRAGGAVRPGASIAHRGSGGRPSHRKIRTRWATSRVRSCRTPWKIRFLRPTARHREPSTTNSHLILRHRPPF